MKRFPGTWLAVGLLVASAVSAYAGESGTGSYNKDEKDSKSKSTSTSSSKKCTESTQECLDHMATRMKSSGWVGVELDVDETTGIMTVNKVIPGSPAEAAGIQPKDVLYALNGVRIAKDNEEALWKARKEWKPGQAVTYTIKRDGMDRQVSLTLAPMPADVLARYIGQHMLEHANLEVAKASK